MNKWNWQWFLEEDKNPFCLGFFGISATKNQHRSTFPFPQLKVQCCKEKDPKNCYIMSLTVLHMAPNTTKTRDPPDGMVGKMLGSTLIGCSSVGFSRHRRSICRLCLGGLMTSLPLELAYLSLAATGGVEVGAWRAASMSPVVTSEFLAERGRIGYWIQNSLR